MLRDAMNVMKWRMCLLTLFKYVTDYDSVYIVENFCAYMHISIYTLWIYIRRPLVAVRGSAPRKLLQKIVVERWRTWRARLEHESCCFAWLEHGWLAGFQVLRCAKVCLAWGNLFFVFSRFQKQRFGIFLFSAFFVGSKSNVSAVFWLRFRMVWAYIPFFLMGSDSDVSAFFRLRFRNGLGTKPAGVLPFRMRVPNTFFLSLAWWLAGFFFVFSRVQKQGFGSFLAAVSHGLGPISFSF